VEGVVWKSRYFLIALVLLVTPSSNSAADDALRPKDRPEFILYGEVGFHNNNLAGAGYQSRWFLAPESRLLFLGNRAHSEEPRPYVKLSGSLTSANVPDENIVVWSLGTEIRPFSRVDFHLPRGLGWLKYGRFYAEWLGQGFWRGLKPSWQPRINVIAGFDSYIEFAAANPDKAVEDPRNWAEVLVGAAYQQTNFYITKYQT
jgi:hypothetical protein